MFQNITKLQRGVFVWMVERAGNNKYVFSSSFSPSLNAKKISKYSYSQRRDPGAYIRHKLLGFLLALLVSSIRSFNK